MLTNFNFQYQSLFQLLPKSASVRGFFLFHFSKDLAAYVMKQVQFYNEGKLKSYVDLGEKSSAGPFVGLEKIYDAVEVCWGFFC